MTLTAEHTFAVASRRQSGQGFRMAGKARAKSWLPASLGNFSIIVKNVMAAEDMDRAAAV